MGLKRVRVVRHYKLVPPYDSSAKIEHSDFVSLSKGLVDPSIHPDIAQYCETSMNSAEREGFDLIVTSPKKRAHDTGQFIKETYCNDAVILVHDALTECTWDPDATVSRLDEYLNCIADCCIKDRWSLITQLERELLDSEHSRILLISHSFIIRSLHAYFVQGLKVWNNVMREDLTSKATIEPDYLKGFEFILK